MEVAEDLEIALAVSDEAARRALEYARRGVRATKKADGSLVTEADRDVERLIRHRLAELRPGDAVLAEEFGRSGRSDRVWVVDPIDGTSGFARGHRSWRVHIALAVDGHLEVGVVTAPSMGVQWWASRGNGAFRATWPRRRDARRLWVSATASVEDSLIAGIGSPTSRAPGRRAMLPTSGHGWCDPMVQLLEGRVDAVVARRYKIWDHAPWVVLVEEAGGHFLPARPDALAHGGGVYTNGLIDPA